MAYNKTHTLPSACAPRAHRMLARAKYFLCQEATPRPDQLHSIVPAQPEVSANQKTLSHCITGGVYLEVPLQCHSLHKIIVHVHEISLCKIGSYAQAFLAILFYSNANSICYRLSCNNLYSKCCICYVYITHYCYAQAVTHKLYQLGTILRLTNVFWIHYESLIELLRDQLRHFTFGKVRGDQQQCRTLDSSSRSTLAIFSDGERASESSIVERQELSEGGGGGGSGGGGRRLQYKEHRVVGIASFAINCGISRPVSDCRVVCRGQQQSRALDSSSRSTLAMFSGGESIREQQSGAAGVVRRRRRKLRRIGRRRRRRQAAVQGTPSRWQSSFAIICGISRPVSDCRVVRGGQQQSRVLDSSSRSTLAIFRVEKEQLRAADSATPLCA